VRKEEVGKVEEQGESESCGPSPGDCVLIAGLYRLCYCVRISPPSRSRPPVPAPLPLRPLRHTQHPPSPDGACE
jgi:hypothetical protein